MSTKPRSLLNLSPTTLAVLLGLMQGGTAFGQVSLSVESRAPLPTGRMAHWQILLPSGRIASIGGHGAGFVALGTADIYDPASDQWTSVAMTSIHDGPALAKLEDGRYLIAGSAYDLGIPASAGVDLFDPVAETFSAAAPMARGRMLPSAATLKGPGAKTSTPDGTSPTQRGKVLVVGAWYDNATAAVGELYDPIANSWTDTGALVSPRCLATVVALDDGRALVFGGIGSFGGAPIDVVEVYDPASNSFSLQSPTLFPEESGWLITNEFSRGVQDNNTLPDGRLLLIASRANPAEQQLFTVNPFDGSIAKWGPTPIPPDDRQISWVQQQPMVDHVREHVFILGYDPLLPRAAMVTRAVPFAGSPITAISNVASTGAWPLFAARTLLADGSIIQTGGHLSDNFDAVPDVYRFQMELLTPPPAAQVEPVLHIRISNPNPETTQYRYLWSSSGADTPVTHGPTTALEDTLSQQPPDVTFDEGETWTVEVTPIGEGSAEGTPAVASFLIGPAGEVRINGWLFQ